VPHADNAGVELYYETDGNGEPVVFVNDVGYGAWLWGWQHAGLAGRYETVVWDLRGTGRSDATPGPYAARSLAGDLEAVLADAGVAGAHLVGAGLGGMVALAYAHRYGRAQSLVLLGTAADGDRVTDRLGDLRADPADTDALRRSLAPAFAADLDDHPGVVGDVVGWRAEDDADPAAWDAQAAAMRGFEPPPLYEITQPALVLHGADDVVVPPAAGESLAADLPRGEFRTVAGGHLHFVEDSGAVTDAIVDFLDER
jgi:pimeloyl-ACP methyl ester carboxylesterase